MNLLLPMTISGLLVTGMGVALLGSVMIPLARKLEIDETRVGGMVSMFGFAMIPAIFTAGFLTDLVGKQAVLTGGCLLMTGSLILLARSRVYPTALVSVLLFSASWSAMANVINVLMKFAFLEPYDHLLPGHLSGGMMKRVALARALIESPEIVLCDEPFSGLDPLAVRMIESLLVKLNGQLDITMIITNHHIASTLRMADQVVFLMGGTGVCGSADDLRESHDPRIRSFLRADGAEPLEVEDEIPALPEDEEES